MTLVQTRSGFELSVICDIIIVLCTFSRPTSIVRWATGCDVPERCTKHYSGRVNPARNYTQPDDAIHQEN